MKIQHNKKLFWMIIVLIAVLVVLIYLIVQQEEVNEECRVDGDCTPATCCHSDGCVAIEQVRDCSGVMCTEDCSGPLDCGKGHCGCVKRECIVVSD